MKLEDAIGGLDTLVRPGQEGKGQGSVEGRVEGRMKCVYAFGDGKAEGQAGMKNLLGGKGANLAEMSNLGLPVPPGFTITTEVCTAFYANDRRYPAELEAQVTAAVAR